MMDRREFLLTAVASAARPTVARLSAQRPAPRDLAALADAQRFQIFNRSVSRFAEGSMTGARLSAAAREGIAYLAGVELANGTIACDLRGKDVPQQSFVGLAFHGVDGTAYDAIYFRPFNFRAQDPVSHR